jgi:high-affinity nickel permease
MKTFPGLRKTPAVAVISSATLIILFVLLDKIIAQDGSSGIIGYVADPLLSFVGEVRVSVLLLGFTLGLRHALDTDHLIAVSTIVSEHKGFSAPSIIGLMWGLGHTASLFIVGLIVIALQVEIQERVAQTMELAVAAMLIGLGANVLWKLLRGWHIHTHMHAHGTHVHIHPHTHAHVHSQEGEQVQPHHTTCMKWLNDIIAKNLVKGKRAVVIGMVHGLAGSASLMLVVLATIHSAVIQLVYIVVFGIGSIGGMLVMSSLIGIPFALTAQKAQRLNLAVRGASGVLSIAMGLVLAWQIGIMDGLFLK